MPAAEDLFRFPLLTQACVLKSDRVTMHAHAACACGGALQYTWT